ncbi:MAG: metal ABC transporter permease [Inquilinus sp.]|nr:metal ABC transporter permease [Inquilinus sp.]
MILTVEDFLHIDLPALMAAVLAAVSCGLLGNFLVLRRQALIGDAISHLVLPGIVVGFLIAGEVLTVAMMAGALGAALVGVLLIEAIRRLGGIESGAAMGVVFTVMFAAGVVLLEQTGSAAVHLDVEHALYGALETTLWLTPTGWESLADPAVWATLPREVTTLAAVTAIVVAAIVLFYKELKIVAFDPDLATSLGFSARTVSAGLVVLVAMAAVAAFDAVGSILVIAMFICPASTARMLTDRLSRQLLLSVLAATLAGIGGYVLAAFGPFWFGGENSLNAAGMIAVVAGALQTLAMLLAPRYGVLPRMFRRWRIRATG